MDKKLQINPGMNREEGEALAEKTRAQISRLNESEETDRKALEQLQRTMTEANEAVRAAKGVAEPEPAGGGKKKGWWERREEEKEKKRTEKEAKEEARLEEEHPPFNPEKEVADFIAEFKLESLLPAEFSDLSIGQKLLVIRGLKQRIVDLVKDDAQTQYSEGLKSWIASSGKIKAIGKSIATSLLRENDLKNLETTSLEAIRDTAEFSSLIARDLEQLTKTAKERECYAGRFDKKPIIRFVSGFEASNREEMEIIDNFNFAANNFREMPYEWGQEKGGKHKKEYEKAKAEYERARVAVLEIKARKETPHQKGKAMLEMLRLDNVVQMDQLLNTHPELEKELAHIAETAGGREFAKYCLNALQAITGGKNWTNKALFAGGYGLRWATVSMGLAYGLAAPIVGATIGGFRGRMRGKQTLEERKKQARHGQKDASEEANKVVSAAKMVEHLERILYDLENLSNTPQKRDALLKRLRIRIGVTQEKTEAGLMDFGDTRSVLSNQFNLVNSLNRALVILENSEEANMAEVNARIEKLLSFRTEKISEAQKKFIFKQMRNGALWGAGFATAGYGVRWLGEHLGWWGNAISEQTPMAETPEPAQAPIEHIEQNDTSAGFMERAKKWMGSIFERDESIPTDNVINEKLTERIQTQIDSINELHSQVEGLQERLRVVTVSGGTNEELENARGALEVANNKLQTYTDSIAKLNTQHGVDSTTIAQAQARLREDRGIIDELRRQLNESGGGTEPDTPESAPGTPPTSTQISSVEEYMRAHPEATHEIRRSWYDNNSEVFDKNELRTHWGGEQGTGINNEGKYILDVSRMTADGSSHGTLSANTQELLKEGKLKFLISATSGTQNQVFEVPIDANGQIVIDPNSEIGKMFFTNVDGHAQFTGRFGEVAEKLDDNNNFKILSTIEGSHPTVETEAGIREYFGRDDVIPRDSLVPRIPLKNLETPIGGNIPAGEISEPPAPPSSEVKSEAPTAEELRRKIIEAMSPAATGETMATGPHNVIVDNTVPVYDQYAYPRSGGYNTTGGSRTQVWDQFRHQHETGRNIFSSNEATVTDPYIDQELKGENISSDNTVKTEDPFAPKTDPLTGKKIGETNIVSDNTKEPANPYADQEFKEKNIVSDDTVGIKDPFAPKPGELPLPAEFAGNNFDLLPNELQHVYETHEANISHLLPADRSISWSQMNKLDARDVIKEGSRYGTDPKFQPLFNYVRTLMKVTKTEPIGGLFRTNENIGTYIARALQKAQSEGNLDSLRLR